MHRIGWGVRRVTRWAVNLHLSLLKALTAQSDSIVKLAGHPNLASLSEVQRLKAAMVVIHTRWITLTRQQEKWNQDFPTIFSQTKPQTDDSELLEKWGNQVQDIQKWQVTGKLSCIPGNFTPDLTGVEVDGDEELPEGFSVALGEEDEEDDDDDDAEKQWVDSLDQEVVTAVLSEAAIVFQADEGEWLLDEDTFEL